MKGTIESKKAILDLQGGTCTSCSIAIEHLGRKIDGIADIFVDRGTSTIQVEYDGDRTSLDRIVQFVDKIGYEASIRVAE